MSVSWASGVNQRVLREGGAWEIPNGTKADKTKSGKIKMRAAESCAPMTYKVQMRFTPDEYSSFMYWYLNTTQRGALTFLFPQIDAVNGVEVEYGFVPGTSISVRNPSARSIDVNMEWYSVN